MNKFLLVAEAYHPRIGGGVRYEIDIVNHFRSLGNQFDIITVGDSYKTTITKENGGKVIRLSNQIELSTARLSFGMISFFFKELDKYDIIHFNAPNPLGELSYLIYRIFRKSNAKTICSFHGEVVSAKPLYRLYNNWLLKRHLNSCDVIIASTPNILKTTPLLYLYKEKVNVIPYGIDVDKFRPPDNISVNNTEINYLFVGRLVRYKGLFVLIDAIAKTKGFLRVIGDGPLKIELENKVINEGLSERVKFLGKISDSELLEKYRSSDVIVLPSIDRGESYGYVIVEGMASGSCAISSELGTGTSFVNLHKNTGLVVEPGSISELVKAIEYLNNNPKELIRFKENALRRARMELSKEKMLKRTSELYESLLL